LGASWTVTTIVCAPDGTQIADSLVQFSPDKFYLTWVGVHEDYRGRKISSMLYNRISSFLERERPGYAFSSNAINEATQHLSRQYFDILNQRGKKMRGRVRNPNAPDTAN
jgi:ribosomal protein S18 acetylase RimI-like enzyme